MIASVASIAIPGILAGIVLAGMHTYFGLHIIERRVLFLGLTLAQWAALGSSIGALIGYPPHTPMRYIWSGVFALLGVVVVELTRRDRETRMPQETILALVYAITAAITVVIIAETPLHIRGSDLLSVSLHRVAWMAMFYAAVGAVLLAFHQRFLTGGTWWHFCYYGLLAIIITSSVSVAGVVLVFAYLTVPAVVATMLSKQPGARLAIGWVVGAVSTAGGILASLVLDWPTDAAVVCTLGVALAITGAYVILNRARRRRFG